MRPHHHAWNYPDNGNRKGNAGVGPKTNRGGMNWDNGLDCTLKGGREATDLATIIGSFGWRVSFAVNSLFMKLESGRAPRSAPGLSRWRALIWYKTRDKRKILE